MVFRHFINSNSYFPLELKRINEAIGPVIADIPFQRASPRVIYKSFSDEYSVPGLDFKLLSQKFVGKHNYEVDFLIADGDKVSPVEVKSSGYKAHTSLDTFCGKFSSRIRNKYLIYTKDMRKDGDVLYLPVYMTMFL